MSGVRIGAVWMAALATWMGLLSLLLWLWTDDDLAPALLTGAAGALALIAVFAATVSLEPTGPRRLAESSLATVAIVIGVAMAVNGLTFGLFLILIGAQVAALGVAGLVRQHIVDRRRGG
jgi:hypothetical protein